MRFGLGLVVGLVVMGVVAASSHVDATKVWENRVTAAMTACRDEDFISICKEANRENILRGYHQCLNEWIESVSRKGLK